MKPAKSKLFVFILVGVIGTFSLLHARNVIADQTYEYYLPLFSISPSYATGIALSNTSPSGAATVSLWVYDRNGVQIPVQNPPSPIKADGQFFDVVKTAKNVEGSMVVISDQPLTGLCFLAAIGSETDSYMADIPLASEKYTLLHVPHVAYDDNWDTILYVSNPNNFSVTVNIDVVNSAGTVVLKTSPSFNAFASAEIRLAELLSGQPLTGGKVKLSSTGGIAAFALYHNLKTDARNFAGINAADPSFGAGGSIVGAWGEEVFTNGGYGCLVLYADGKFINFDSTTGGVEYGTFAFDAETGFAGKEILRDDNGENGLADNGVPYAGMVTVVGDYFIVENPEDPDDPEMKTVLKRVFDDQSPIVGAWAVSGASEGYSAMVFYSNGKYFHYESGKGAEYGTYSHNNATGVMNKAVVFDANGPYGLADNGIPYNDQVLVSGDVLSVKNLDDPSDTASAERVK